MKKFLAVMVCAAMAVALAVCCAFGSVRYITPSNPTVYTYHGVDEEDGEPYESDYIKLNEGDAFKVEITADSEQSSYKWRIDYSVSKSRTDWIDYYISSENGKTYQITKYDEGEVHIYNEGVISIGYDNGKVGYPYRDDLNQHVDDSKALLHVANRTGKTITLSGTFHARAAYEIEAHESNSHTHDFLFIVNSNYDIDTDTYTGDTSNGGGSGNNTGNTNNNNGGTSNNTTGETNNNGGGSGNGNGSGGDSGSGGCEPGFGIFALALLAAALRKR